MIAFASDHAGVDLRNALMKRMVEIVDVKKPDDAYVWHNLGPYHHDCVDYPIYANRLCRYLLLYPDRLGVLICGTGIGMSICANRYMHIRCAVATNVQMAEAARRHNDANVLALGARLIDENAALLILQSFLHTPYEGGRHDTRVAMMNCLL